MLAAPVVAVLVGVGSGSAARLDGPLSISPPANITVTATDVCGQSNCASVDYSFTVTGGYPPYNLVCNLPSGGEFLVGTHTVSCLAQDSKGNSTPPASFQLTVTPGGPTPGPPPPPPAALSISPPAAITVAATDVCGQSNCASVDYSFTVTGGYPPYNLVCNLPSGGQFTVGTHTVSCLAQDSKGNSTPPASFQLTVTPGGPTPGPPPPPPAALSISPPAAITVAATGPCGQTYCATASYSFTVSGGYPPYNLVCNLPSGGQFTVGTHTISCLAQDSKGDSTPPASFQLTVTPAGGDGSGSNASGSSSSGGGASPSGSSTSGASGSGSAPSSASSTHSSAPSSGSSGSSGSGSSGSGGKHGSPPASSPLSGSSVSMPILATTGNGRRTLSFSVRLSAAAFLQIALLAPSGKTVMHFVTAAKKGRTRLTKTVPSIDLTKGSHLTLKITMGSHGKTRTITLRLKA